MRGLQLQETHVEVSGGHLQNGTCLPSASGEASLEVQATSLLIEKNELFSWPCTCWRSASQHQQRGSLQVCARAALAACYCALSWKKVGIFVTKPSRLLHKNLDLKCLECQSNRRDSETVPGKPNESGSGDEETMTTRFSREKMTTGFSAGLGQAAAKAGCLSRSPGLQGAALP